MYHIFRHTHFSTLWSDANIPCLRSLVWSDCFPRFLTTLCTECSVCSLSSECFLLTKLTFHWKTVSFVMWLLCLVLSRRPCTGMSYWTNVSCLIVSCHVTLHTVGVCLHEAYSLVASSLQTSFLLRQTHGSGCFGVQLSSILPKLYLPVSLDKHSISVLLVSVAAWPL